MLKSLDLQCSKSSTDTILVQLVLGSGGTLKSFGLVASLCQSPFDVSLEDVEIHNKSLETLSLYSEYNHDKGLLSACKVRPLLNSLAKGYLLFKSVNPEFRNIEEKGIDATFMSSRANCISLHSSGLNHLLV
ncbi:Hypothetical predicted protein [Olea europaea subsp. europaea]|uniref:Uncharacterized protein n=1 Tax=Olea europaea subsp. europaea TaxID=158383 RepID=A0A8S0U1H3_OLEEU|nr:Hypothetical predicted protein [Olea europaea subsp. europaea]